MSRPDAVHSGLPVHTKHATASVRITSNTGRQTRALGRRQMTQNCHQEPRAVDTNTYIPACRQSTATIRLTNGRAAPSVTYGAPPYASVRATMHTAQSITERLASRRRAFVRISSSTGCSSRNGSCATGCGIAILSEEYWRIACRRCKISGAQGETTEV